MTTKREWMSATLATAAVLGMASIAAVAHAGESAPAPTTAAAGKDASAEINPRLLRRFVPLRARFDAPGATVNNTEIQLGRMLFFDQRLSADRDISCNSCHRLDHYGVDGLSFSVGRKGQLGGRNSPTVFNAAGHFQQFWDGRAVDVEAQARGPMMNPVEMAMKDEKQIEQRLRAIPGYVAAFHAAYPQIADPVSIDNAARAIGAFERGLSTPSRWDRFLRGEVGALTPAEKKGFKVFSNVGCMVCHTGEFLGGSTFQRVGLVEPWPDQKDPGRAQITKSNSDKMVFKVPSLRDVARTGPYFHDSLASDLPTAVRLMGKHQLGLDLDDDEVGSIVTWLACLTGDVDAQYTAKPVLPRDEAGHGPH
jgi:cytochrome c peroxidase